MLLNDQVIRVFTHPHRTWDFQKYKEGLNHHKDKNTGSGFDGTLLFTSHNDHYDPWVAAQWMCEGTNQIPLVAVNPIYQPPFVVARKVKSLMSLYQRSVAINWITGTAKSDLAQLGDDLSKELRYERLMEFVEVFHLYLSGESFDYNGQFYRLKQAHLRSATDAVFEVREFVSGSSQWAQSIAVQLGATQLEMLPASWPTGSLQGKGWAMGVVLGENATQAVERAEELFPSDRYGMKNLQLSMKNTDSTWKQKLFEQLDAEIQGNGYWVQPMANFSEVPFLVASVTQFREYLEKWMAKGMQSLVVSLAHEKDYVFLRRCFDAM